MDWSPEKIEELRILFLVEKKNFRQIADLWSTTRNTIAGQCHRNGFKRGEDRQRESIQRGDIDLAKVKERVEEPKAVAQSKKKPLAPPKPKPVPKAKAAPPKPPPAPVVISQEKPGVVLGRLTVEQLEPHHCRWPTNDDKPFVFCGDQKDGTRPYCRKHCKQMYQPDKPRIKHSAN